MVSSTWYIWGHLYKGVTTLLIRATIHQHSPFLVMWPQAQGASRRASVGDTVLWLPPLSGYICVSILQCSVVQRCKLSMCKISLPCKAARESPRGQTADLQTRCNVGWNNKIVEKENRGNSTDGSHHSLLRLFQVPTEIPSNATLIFGEQENAEPSFSRPPSVQEMCWHCHSHSLKEKSCH